MPRTGPLWSGVGTVPGHSKRPETNWLHLQETLRGRSRWNCPWVKSNWFFFPPFNKLDFNLIKTHLQKSAQIPFLAWSFFFSHAAYEFYMQLIIQLKKQSTASFPQPLPTAPPVAAPLKAGTLSPSIPDSVTWLWNSYTWNHFICTWLCVILFAQHCEIHTLWIHHVACLWFFQACYCVVSHSMNTQLLIHSTDNHCVVSSLVPKCSYLWPVVYTRTHFCHVPRRRITVS